MGLDVYLYEGATYKNLGDEDAYDEEAFDKANEIKSTLYPDHICTPRYIRSSYNSGGLNSVLRDSLGKDLYWVFKPPVEEYEWLPTHKHLEECASRAKQLLEKLRATPAFRVMTEDATGFSQPTVSDSHSALRTFFDEKAKREAAEGRKDPFAFTDYSNKDGTYFFSEPLKVRAVIRGDGLMGRPALHLIYESDLSFYIQALEIIAQEFIPAALAMEKPLLHWSA